ncbi:hypothetical protein [Moraxella equi]|uniref:Uncharacterized protein n=1 Tax=Moraxella equi TaxID=60442 RepID=A0A378QUC6_9GAMM|nr:hypothetical protein [Moraxella equi]OPH40032.1 hypothetical protein B5J93_01115 [Moraxella equi]STZ04487.1 Uncharacterised protein [Moraxella equi]
MATKYGLNAELYFWREEYYGDFSEIELKAIKEQANLVYNKLITAQIILLNPPSYDDDKEFYQELKGNSQS